MLVIQKRKEKERGSWETAVERPAESASNMLLWMGRRLLFLFFFSSSSSPVRNEILGVGNKSVYSFPLRLLSVSGARLWNQPTVNRRKTNSGVCRRRCCCSYDEDDDDQSGWPFPLVSPLSLPLFFFIFSYFHPFIFDRIIEKYFIYTQEEEREREDWYVSSSAATKRTERWIIQMTCPGPLRSVFPLAFD